MTEREEKLLIAAKEILNDFDRYGEVLQTGDNGEYGTESSIGMLNSAILQYIRPKEPKPLAQYLGEYIEHETELELIDTRSGLVSWRELLEQALDAYESTEGVKVRIEPV